MRVLRNHLAKTSTVQRCACFIRMLSNLLELEHLHFQTPQIASVLLIDHLKECVKGISVVVTHEAK